MSVAFERSVVLVTGGTRGLGAAIAQSFRAEGRRVVVCGRRVTAADDPLCLALDVRDPDDVDRVFSWVELNVGALGVLINCAGVARFGPFESLSTADWNDIVDTNLKGAFHCCRAAFRIMKSHGGGRIVNIGSIVDHRAVPGNSAYGASKYGVRGLTLVLAEEGPPHGIFVSLVSPGAVRTEMTAARPGFPPGDMLNPADVARVVLHVANTPLGIRIDEVRVAPAKGLL